MLYYPQHFMEKPMLWSKLWTFATKEFVFIDLIFLVPFRPRPILFGIVVLTSKELQGAEKRQKIGFEHYCFGTPHPTKSAHTLHAQILRNSLTFGRSLGPFKAFWGVSGGRFGSTPPYENELPLPHQHETYFGHNSTLMRQNRAKLCMHEALVFL